jgi:hypothetical protein
MDSSEVLNVSETLASVHTSEIQHINGNTRIKCKCGCVPDIMSLFEMAELRAKKRAADALKLKNM